MQRQFAKVERRFKILRRSQKFCLEKGAMEGLRPVVFWFIFYTIIDFVMSQEDVIWSRLDNGEYGFSPTWSGLHHEAHNNCQKKGGVLAAVKNRRVKDHVIKLASNLQNFGPPYAFHISLVRQRRDEFFWNYSFDERLKPGDFTWWAAGQPTDDQQVLMGDVNTYDPDLKWRSQYREQSRMLCYRVHDPSRHTQAPPSSPAPSSSTLQMTGKSRASATSTKRPSETEKTSNEDDNPPVSLESVGVTTASDNDVEGATNTTVSIFKDIGSKIWNNVHYLGLVIGGILLLLIILLGMVCCLCNRKAKRKGESDKLRTQKLLFRAALKKPAAAAAAALPSMDSLEEDASTSGIMQLPTITQAQRAANYKPVETNQF